MSDLISRRAAIDALCKRCDLVSDDEPCTEECNDIKILKLLPSAQPVIRGVIDESGRIEFIEQPEPKKGKWIVHPEVKNVYGGTYIECSQCGEKYVVQHMKDEKYCRNCGTKMEV